MNLSDHHRTLIIEAAKQVPSAWQQRFASNVMDNLFAQVDLTDEDVINACKVIGEKMEMAINL